MKIVLENIGMLKHAEINLKKLNLIGGKNDNGKSTVGKVIFCIIKALNKYEQNIKEDISYIINKKADELFIELRKNYFKISEEKPENILRIIDEYSGYYFITNQFNVKDKLKIINNLKNEIEKYIEDENFSININKKLNEIENFQENPIKSKKYIEEILNRIFKSEFDTNILFNDEKNGQITLYEDENELIKINININKDKDNVLSISNNFNLKLITIKDATFIESALILNNYDLLIRSQAGLESIRISKLGIPQTMFHIKDLFDKLSLPNIFKKLNNIEENNFQSNIFKKIKKIIAGNILHDEKERKFVYVKDKKEISIKNTAGGIKSFGILQLLLYNNILIKNSILIIDEPENHLHPNWQLKYAEILTILAENGVTILVTSHSPYFIEALNRYSKEKCQEEDINFYLAENNSIDPENKLEEILLTLNEPFKVFREMDKRILSNE